MLVLCVLTLGFALLSLGVVNQTPYAIEDEQEEIFIVLLALGLLLLFVLWACRLLRFIDYYNLLPALDRVIVFVVIAAFLYCIIGVLQCVVLQTSYTWLNQGTHISYVPSDDTYRIVKKDSYFVFLDRDGSAVNYNVKNDTNSFILNNNLAMVDGNPEIAAVNVNGEKQETTTYIWGMSKQEAAKNEWNLFLILSPKSVSTTNTTLVTFVNDAALKALNLNLNFH